MNDKDKEFKRKIFFNNVKYGSYILLAAYIALGIPEVIFTKAFLDAGLDKQFIENFYEPMNDTIDGKVLNTLNKPWREITYLIFE